MNKVYNYCGTINDAHHSAACVDEQRKTNVGWHESHKQAIKEKWVQAPQELKERRERIATAVAAGIMACSHSCDRDTKYVIADTLRITDALIKALDEVKE